MDSEYSETDRVDEPRDGVEVRETHPLLNDSEREMNVISVEVTKPTAPPEVSEPSTSASAIRRQSQNSSSEDVADRGVDVVTTEPLSSALPPGESPNHSLDPDTFARNHNQLKSKFDADEPDSVEGYAHKICCNFIQCCAIFIEG